MFSTVFLISCAYTTVTLIVAAVPSSDLGGRIVGGNDIQIEDVPYQISLEIDGRHQCGGSIISPNFIITAGHCTHNKSEASLAVRAGSSTRESGGQLVNVKKNNVYPNYAIFDYDFAILELSTNLTFSNKVKTIDLPNRSQSWPGGTEVLASGWGLLSDTSTSLPVNLQGVNTKIIDQETCNVYYWGEINERMICAGETGKGVCSADSGGPLQADGVLIGVVSWSGSGCAWEDAPGVYANVVAFLDYVQEITGI